MHVVRPIYHRRQQRSDRTIALVRFGAMVQDVVMIIPHDGPRPLLISNTDSDGIFPLDGVYRLFKQVRRIYRLHGDANKVALNITAGGRERNRMASQDCSRPLRVASLPSHGRASQADSHRE